LIIISFFKDYENSISFLTSPGTKLSSIIAVSSELKKMLSIDNADVYHPISGRRIDFENDIVSEETSVVF